MPKKTKILLVAKPWKGGLARYLYMTLSKMYNDQVYWLKTYPETKKEYLFNMANKKEWCRKIVSSIDEIDYSAAIFIGIFPLFKSTKNKDKNILWLPDGPKLTKEQLDPYVRVFLCDKGYESDILNIIGSDVYAGELTFACHPDVHSPYNFKSSHKKQQICFIGNKDPKRECDLKTLFNFGVFPIIFGNFFFRSKIFWRYPSYFRPSIKNDDMGKVYSNHEIALNIHANVNKHGTNMRTFECAGYEIPQIVEYLPGIENYFDIDKELLVYNNLDEVPQLIERLKSDTSYFNMIKKNAKKRVLAEHTYYHRVLSLLSHLSLK